MKISKIAKLCKDAKLVCTTSTEAGLWIGNGSAVYFVPDFEGLGYEGIALALGIDKKKKEKIIFTNIDMNEFNLEDIDPSESLCTPMGIEFRQGGDNLRPYRTEAGVLCFVSSYLEPFRDESEVPEIYLRYTKDERPYFAVKVGMLLHGIVIPAKEINFEFMKKLGEMYEMCKSAMELEEKRFEAEKDKSAEQIKMEDAQ